MFAKTYQFLWRECYFCYVIHSSFFKLDTHLYQLGSHPLCLLFCPFAFSDAILGLSFQLDFIYFYSFTFREGSLYSRNSVIAGELLYLLDRHWYIDPLHRSQS